MKFDDVITNEKTPASRKGEAGVVGFRLVGLEFNRSIQIIRKER